MVQPRYDIASHPDRERLVNEAHARPAQPCGAPAAVSRLMMLTGEADAGRDRDHIVALCRSHGAPEPAEGARHHVVDAGPARVVWERHTEFSTYTIYREAVGADPIADMAVDAVNGGWLAGVPGRLLAAAHLVLVAAPDGGLDEDLARRFLGRDDFAASRLRGETASAATDFRLHPDGFGRILVCDSSAEPMVRGRLVQRLLEVETYRLAALLALPVAREAQPETGRLESELNAMSHRIAAPPHMSKDRDLLQRLSQLAGQAEELSARCNYRFAAARAYHRLVLERIERVRETRLEGRERLGAFITRRLAPAMRTCDATAERQAAVAARIDRAVRLLATRVEVEVEEQNALLLASMDRRADQQLRLQETVEGLSAVAITYYGVGLVAYAAKGLRAAGLRGLDPAIVSAVAAPVVFALVWAGVRRMRARLHREAGEKLDTNVPAR